MLGDTLYTHMYLHTYRYNNILVLILCTASHMYVNTVYCTLLLSLSPILEMRKEKETRRNVCIVFCMCILIVFNT